MAKLSLEQRVKNDPKLLARVLANPGLRAKLPDKYLTQAQRRQRTLNARLRQPIVPGATTTERDLAREAQAAMTVKYGPLEAQQKQTLGEEQTRARDTAGFYDQYLRQIAQHARNVQTIGANAAQAGLGLQQGVTGLSAASLTGLQNPANADAAARGAQAGDLSPLASNAAAIRQALTGSFVAQQAGQNAAAQDYADTQAHVVAPGQKLAAQAMMQGRVRQAGEGITATARERAADDLVYRSTRRSDEGKTVLARQIAGIDAADKAADNALAANSKYGPGSPVPNSYGFTYDEWKRMSGKERDKWRSGKATRPPAKPPSTTGYGSGKTGQNKYGFTYDEWAKLSDADRTRYRTGEATRAPHDGKKPNGRKGPEWVTPGQSGAAMTQLLILKQAAVKARSGEPYIEGHGKQKPEDRAGTERKILKFAPISGKLKHPALLTAALDAVWLHFLPASTVAALKAAGYKPSEVARTLGVQTSGQVKASDPKPGGIG